MKRLLCLLFLLVFLPATAVLAEQVACAKVVIEIVQELTLERVAFDAKLAITNNLPDKDLQNIRVDVTIKDGEGNLRDELFFVKVASLDGLDDVAGSGTVYANTKGVAHWLIVPSPGAGGDYPEGIEYFVGATLSYSVNDVQEIVPINPDRIIVRPTAKLYLDYFMPHEVLGDNPFTTSVEPPVPFPLAVRVINDGYGPANKLKIESAQPKIVDNKQGLLVNFRLLGAAVNDQSVNPSLTVDMGDVTSKKAATGFWEMISTLSGRFEGLEVSFTHDPGLGGELTSLIQETNAFYLTHRVKVNLPGRDGLLDFLADTDRDDKHLPNAIFESEIPAGGLDRNDALAEVKVLQPLSLPARPTPETPEVSVTLDVSTHAAGWIYSRMDDPSQGLLDLQDVVRADGIHLDPHNFWVEEGLDENYKPIFTLQFVDYRANSATPGWYTLVFVQPDEDLTPPVTLLVFDGPAIDGAPTYLTPETRVVLTAVDNDGGSGVEQMFKKTGSDSGFLPAVPFNLEAGSFSLEFYSVDRAGNVEATKSIDLVVDDAAPEMTVALQASPDSFIPQAPEGVSAARGVDFTFTASDSVPQLSVTLEIINSTGSLIRTLEGTAVSGTAFALSWDGLGTGETAVPPGVYTANLTVADGLGHLVSDQVTLTASDWFAGTPVDPLSGVQQLYPAISGTQVVWQDDRYGHFDIFTKNLLDLATPSIRVTSDPGNQERAAIDGNQIVWQDTRGGDWDIYSYDLVLASEQLVTDAVGDQVSPVTAGGWVAWQDNRDGNWDIYAKNIASGELIQVTSHERDQIRPAFSANTLVWEDYRHGLGEIYAYDLVSRVETRLTFDLENQFLPAVSGGMVVWTEQRDGQQEIYGQSSNLAQRLTYGSGNRSQASLYGNLLVYTDSSNGETDPNLGFLDLAASTGGVLTDHLARQQEPAAGNEVVAWQDDRDGSEQIYMAALSLVELPISVNLKTGFNLIAVGQVLVEKYVSAAGLINNIPADAGVDHVLSYSAPHGQFLEAELSGGDFALASGMALVVYAQQNSVLEVAAAGEEISYTLLPGTNHVGILRSPVGYRAFDLLSSLGIEKVVSVRRYESETGLWQSAAVRDTDGALVIVGNNFRVRSGEGLVVTMKERVDGWQP